MLVEKFFHSIKTALSPNKRMAQTPADFSLFDLFGYQYPGNPLSDKQLEQLSTVYTCLKVLSETIAQLPFGIYKKGQYGGVCQYGNPLYFLIHNEPHKNMSAYDFWYALIYMRNAWGNGYAYIERDSYSGAVVSMKILNAWEVTLTIDLQGEVWYTYRGSTINSYNIFHIKNHPKNGLLGVSPIRENAVTLQQAAVQDQYAGKVFGKKPPGFLTYSGNVSETQKAESRKSWQTQVDNGTPVLPGGWDYKSIMIPPGDAQYITSRQYSKIDIAGIYRIPPSFLQVYDKASYASSEQEDLHFVKHTITPIIQSIEQEIERKLLPPSNANKSNPLYAHINVDGLLRGDINTRMNSYKTMWAVGAMSANDILEKENQVGYEGGGRHYVQAGFIPVDKVDQFLDSKTTIHDTQNTQNTQNQKDIGFKLDGEKIKESLILNKKTNA